MATFRHKTIRRFKVGKFEFKNNLLSIPDDNESDIELFHKFVSELPRREQVNIVEVNEAALKALEKPMTLGVRGAASTSDITAPKTNAPSTGASPSLTPAGVDKALGTSTAPAAPTGDNAGSILGGGGTK